MTIRNMPRALVCCGALFAVTVANAAVITANISFTINPSSEGSGSGSMTITNGTLTAFSFTDTLTLNSQTETYSYGLGDILSFADSTPAATGLNNLVFNLTTNSKNGAPAVSGPSAFNIAYSASNPGTGAALGSNFTVGGSVVLSAATASGTPEPATIALVGLLGAGMLALKRRLTPDGP